MPRKGLQTSGTSGKYQPQGINSSAHYNGEKEQPSAIEGGERRARLGVLATLEERTEGRLAMVLDTVDKIEGSAPAEWVFRKHFTSLEHPVDLMANLQLTRKELADIGEALVIWLMSQEGRLK